MSVSQPDDTVRTVAAGIKNVKGPGSAKDILQLYKDADVNQFILMSRESSVSLSAGSPPRRQTGTAEHSILESQAGEGSPPRRQTGTAEQSTTESQAGEA